MLVPRATLIPRVYIISTLYADVAGQREASPAKPGDHFSFFAETDLLCALSTCPGGDLSVYGWGGDSAQRMLATCKPLGVAIYEIKERDEVLRGWTESVKAGYNGFHGFKTPVFGEE